MERLLRNIYQPQNYYCLHLDTAAPDEIRVAAQAMVDCLDNVFLLTKAHSFEVDELWSYNALSAELACMEMLLHFNKWKYYITMNSQMVPMKTNHDLVSILRAINGGILVSGKAYSDVPGRKKIKTGIQTLFNQIRSDANSPLQKVKFVNGVNSIVAPREFIHFAVNDPVAKEFQKELYAITTPNNYFFSSLAHSPLLGVPGAVDGEPVEQSVTRHVRFHTTTNECPEKYVNWICLVGPFQLGDIKSDTMALYVEGVEYGYYQTIYDCLEQRHANITKHQITGTGNSHLNLHKYVTYSSVHNKVKVLPHPNNDEQ